MIFKILAILLTILLGLCIIALARDIAHFCSSGRWSQYIKLRKRERQILLTSRVKYKIFPVILYFVYLLFIIFSTAHLTETDISYILIFMYLFTVSGPLLLYSICSTPKSIELMQVSTEALIIRHACFTDIIPLSDIEQINVATPGKNRLFTFGNLGLFGYFGKWSDDANGEYTAYFGRRDQCFLVKTKTGLKYMLGCKRYKEVVELVHDRIR